MIKKLSGPNPLRNEEMAPQQVQQFKWSLVKSSSTHTPTVGVDTHEHGVFTAFDSDAAYATASGWVWGKRGAAQNQPRISGRLRAFFLSSCEASGKGVEVEMR